MTDIPLPLDPPQPKKPGRLSDKAESLNLLHYGTAAFSMTPAMVIQAAEKDISSHRHNIEVAAERKNEKVKTDPHPELIDPTRPLAFLKRHVKTAKTPADVLRAACCVLRWLTLRMARGRRTQTRHGSIIILICCKRHWIRPRTNRMSIILRPDQQ